MHQWFRLAEDWRSIMWKIAVLAIWTHDLWIRKWLCYPYIHCTRAPHIFLDKGYSNRWPSVWFEWCTCCTASRIQQRLRRRYQLWSSSAIELERLYALSAHITNLMPQTFMPNSNSGLASKFKFNSKLLLWQNNFFSSTTSWRHRLTLVAIGHASGNENISFGPLFMIHNDVIGHLIRHFSMENHYKLS